MPPMPKKIKTEWAFFINKYGNFQYNRYCKICQKDCKQSFRALLIRCPHFIPKQTEKGKE